MAHVTAGHDVNDVFGDIGGVVRDAFQILGHQNELKGRKDHGRIFHHVGEVFAKDLIVQVVHLIIALYDGMGQFGDVAVIFDD